MIILGLDPGSVRFGYGAVRADGARLTYLAAGVISAPAGWDKYRRLAQLGRELAEVLEEIKPEAAAIEAGFVKGQMGALTSGAARGVAGYLCALRGLAVVEYAPSTVKLAVAGHGHAEKELVARTIRLQLGMNREAEPDAADALAVAVCHARRPTGVVLGARKGKRAA